MTTYAQHANRNNLRQTFTPDAAIKQQFADRRMPITRPNQPAEDAARVAELVGEYRRQPPVFVSGKRDVEGDMLAAYWAGTPEEKAAAEAWLNALPFGKWEDMPDPAPVVAVEPCYAIPFTAEDVSLLWDTEDDDAPFSERPESL